MEIKRARQTIQRRSKTIMSKANEINSSAIARSKGEQNGRTHQQAGDLSPLAKVGPEAQPRQRDTNWSKQTLALFQSSMRYNEKVISVVGPDHDNTPPPLFLR
jgi:hypothetical protein